MAENTKDFNWFYNQNKPTQMGSGTYGLDWANLTPIDYSDRTTTPDSINTGTSLPQAVTSGSQFRLPFEGTDWKWLDTIENGITKPGALNILTNDWLKPIGSGLGLLQDFSNMRLWKNNLKSQMAQRDFQNNLALQAIQDAKSQREQRLLKNSGMSGLAAAAQVEKKTV